MLLRLVFGPPQRPKRVRKLPSPEDASTKVLMVKPNVRHTRDILLGKVIITE